MLHLLKKYLEINQFANKTEDFEESFQSHPNYPSIYAITDSLDLLGIENIAIKVPHEQLAELPNVFLAFFNQDLVLVTKTEKALQIETEKEGKKHLTFDDFNIGWNGIILAIEPNTNTVVSTTTTNTKWLAYSLPLFIITTLSISFNQFNYLQLAMFFASIVGFLASIFIIQEKLGTPNLMVSKICNLNTNTSCDTVIKSNNSNINKWVDFSDLSLLFFGINLIAIVIAPNTFKFIGTISLITIPILLYSIWLQKFKIKKWCVLCLIVSLIIIFQTTIFIYEYSKNTTFDFSNLYFYLTPSVIVTTVWLFIRPILEAKNKLENVNTELKKFKRNYDVFKYLSKEIPVIDSFRQLQGLVFGNPDAKVKLSVIVSPSCGHCHKAYKEAFELVTQFPDKIYLNIMFNINPENDNNPYKVVVERLLEINNLTPHNKAEALSDWHIKNIGLESWKAKWQIDNISMKVNHQIEKQYQWCVTNEFNFTPIKIVNDKLLPNEYDISELKYFLNEISEEEVIEQEADIIQI